MGTYKETITGCVLDGNLAYVVEAVITIDIEALARWNDTDTRVRYVTLEDIDHFTVDNPRQTHGTLLKYLETVVELVPECRHFLRYLRSSVQCVATLERSMPTREDTLRIRLVCPSVHGNAAPANPAEPQREFRYQVSRNIQTIELKQVYSPRLGELRGDKLQALPRWAVEYLRERAGMPLSFTKDADVLCMAVAFAIDCNDIDNLCAGLSTLSLGGKSSLYGGLEIRPTLKPGRPVHAEPPQEEYEFRFRAMEEKQAAYTPASATAGMRKLLTINPSTGGIIKPVIGSDFHRRLRTRK